MKKRTVIIAGATGLVGREILMGLLADERVTEVISLNRRASEIQHPKLTSHVVNFEDLPPLPDSEELYLAVGTTIKVAGSQDAFREVDFDVNLAVAKAALIAGVKLVGLVSAMGADSNSKIFYNRVKGDLENALTEMPFEGIVIARPSLLVGDREVIGQQTRLGEKLGLGLGKALGFLIPANFKPIEAKAVAKALLTSVPVAKGKLILLSGSMRRP